MSAGCAGERVKFSLSSRRGRSPNPNKSLKFRIRRFRNRTKFARCEIRRWFIVPPTAWMKTNIGEEWTRKRIFLNKNEQISKNYKVTKWKINLISLSWHRSRKCVIWNDARDLLFAGFCPDCAAHRGFFIGNRRVGSTRASLNLSALASLEEFSENHQQTLSRLFTSSIKIPGVPLSIHNQSSRLLTCPISTRSMWESSLAFRSSDH